MLKYFNYLNNKKEFKTYLDELKWLLGQFDFYDKNVDHDKYCEELNEMTDITFDIKYLINVYERWLERLNKLTLKQKLFYKGTEFLRG